MMPDPDPEPWHNPGCHTLVLSAVALLGLVLAAVLIAVT
jgi:hypothetical protein